MSVVILQFIGLEYTEIRFMSICEKSKISKTFLLFLYLSITNCKCFRLHLSLVCLVLFWLARFLSQLPPPTPFCLFFLHHCSSKLQDHLFTWQMQVSSIIVVILSIVQTLHNPENEKYYIHELAKCILLSKLLVKTSKGTIFNFQSTAYIYPDYNMRALLCCYLCNASSRF